MNVEPDGRHFVDGQWLADGTPQGPGHRAHDPSDGAPLAPDYHDASNALVDRAARAAERAFAAYRGLSAERRAAFLRSIAQEIDALGPALLERAHRETGLPLARLASERGRTVAQLRLFADVVEEGSWVEARVDLAIPERQPLPKPDLRRCLVPLGPVAVFGSSNFPLAFSVAGGDTVSALAAGCPVVVKAHPAHPGTSELVGRAVAAACEVSDIPRGTFALLHGASHRVGEELVRHAAIRAVGFTGSYAGGRALCDLAAGRDEPIPVYAEMGSANPVFVLPRALAERGEEIARGLAASVTLGAGQFCTNPGLAIVPRSASRAAFLDTLAGDLQAAPPGLMVHRGIRLAYERALEEVAAVPGLNFAARGPGSIAADDDGSARVAAALAVVDAATFQDAPRLAHEIYGPITVAIEVDDLAAACDLARGMAGHLTATLHGTAEDLEEASELVAILVQKVGRLVINGFPTGVEVATAMHHGGPYPAASDPRSTSVGTAAITRFARPVCFQNAPDAILPPELRRGNPRGIWRWVDGSYTRESA
jgi:NADP-dependent aldehyde dehydrogenase